MQILISVVIPTFRRPHLLERALLGQVNQNLDKNIYEIIVVSDGKDSNTEKLVEKISKDTDLKITYLELAKHLGPAAARNLGWQNASGEFIAFSDDDCIPDQNWLVEFLKEIKKGAKAGVGKTIVPVLDTLTDYEQNLKRLESAEFVTANCFVKRDLLEKIGGFDEKFTMAWREDSDLYFNLLEAKILVVRNDFAKVYHPVKKHDFGITLREQKKGMFNALLYKKHPKLFREKIMKGPHFLYLSIVGSLILFLVSVFINQKFLALFFLAEWIILSAYFTIKRLLKTSISLQHIFEMIITSILIPPLSIYWRIYGALKFKVFFI